MLDLMEKLVLIALEEESDKVSSRSHYLLRLGISGALALELARLRRIRLEDKKIMVTDETLTKKELLDRALESMKAKKGSKKLATWLYSNATLKLNTKKQLFYNLEDKGIVREEEKRFLGLIPLKRYPVTNPTEKKKLIDRVRKILLGDEKEVNEDERFIVCLIVACRATRIVLSKSEEKQIKEKLKLIAQGKYFQPEDPQLEEVVKGIKYAIAAQAAASGAAGGG